jgi:ribose/xylose/arabinose/galactoside ABC-type transport system permease subunit
MNGVSIVRGEEIFLIPNTQKKAKKAGKLRPTVPAMDTMLLVTSLALTLLFIAISTYFLFFLSRKPSGNAIYLVGPSGSGKTALWSFVRYRVLHGNRY